MILLRKFINYKHVDLIRAWWYNDHKILHYKNIIISSFADRCCINIKTKLGRGHVKYRLINFVGRPCYLGVLCERFYEDDKKYDLYSFTYEPKYLKKILKYSVEYCPLSNIINSYDVFSEKLDKYYTLS